MSILFDKRGFILAKVRLLSIWLLWLTATFSILILTKQQQHQAHGMVLNFEIDDDTFIPNCFEESHETVGEHCHILELFNQTLVDEIKAESMERYLELAYNCSCRLTQLAQLWEDAYNYGDIKNVSEIVERVIDDRLDQQWNNNQSLIEQSSELQYALAYENYPECFWNDMDFFYGISFHLAAKDYFVKKRTNNNPLRGELQDFLRMDQSWMLLRKACRRIAMDKNRVFRYLENLGRLSPLGFVLVIKHSELIRRTYAASKACKMLVLLNMNHYRLRPVNSLLVPVVYDDALNRVNYRSNMSLDIMLVHEQQEKELAEEELLRDQEHKRQEEEEGVDNHQEIGFAGLNDNDSENEVQLENITLDANLGLKSGSVYLLNCARWQRKKFSMPELHEECPMMMMEKSAKNIPDTWLMNHATILDRSLMAVKCACQLLLHNKTWIQVLNDKNVNIMSMALTNHLSEVRMPNFANTPLKAINGWFENAMKRFYVNRKASIKEIIKTLTRQQDPTIFVKRDYSEEALELLRRACNYIMFNYNKGSEEALDELRLIRYLDGLQMISPDKLFTFDLTLQDPNLFKLNALSKMCKPIVY